MNIFIDTNKECYKKYILISNLIDTLNLNKNVKEVYLRTYLGISNNHQLTELPSSIGQLVNLQYLYINKNQLTELPSSICQLVNLQIYK